MSNYQFDGGEFDFNFPSFGTLLEQYAPILIALACLGLFLGLFLWLLHLVADAGLIRAAADLDWDDPATLGSSLSAGVRVLGRMVGMNLILYVPFLIISAVLFGVFFLVAGASLLPMLREGGQVDPRTFGAQVELIVSPLAIALSVPTIYGLMNEGALEAGRVLLATGGGLCLGLLVAVLVSVWWAYQSTVIPLAYQELIGKEKVAA